MHRAFGDAKFLGDRPHSVLRLNEATTDFDRSLFNVIVHISRLPARDVDTVYEQGPELFAYALQDK